MCASAGFTPLLASSAARAVSVAASQRTIMRRACGLFIDTAFEWARSLPVASTIPDPGVCLAGRYRFFRNGHRLEISGRGR